MTRADWPVPALAGDALFLPAAQDSAAPPLVVLLPGAYGGPQDAVAQGLAAALRARHPQADLLVLPLDPFAVTQGNILSKLDGTLAPWRTRYPHIWLAGISLGGLTVLAYLAQSPQGIAGGFVMAPYFGSRALEREVRSAGSAQAWAASQQPDWDECELEKRVWYWLAGGGAHRVPVSLGLARGDRFYPGQRLAQESWPEAHCLSTDGGHDWAAWLALWTVWLDRVDLSAEGGGR